MFESTPLFRKLWPKLLKAFALDAASAQEPAKVHESCTLVEATEFLHKAMQAEVQSTERRAGLVFTTRSSGELMAFSATAEDASRTAAPSAAPAVRVAAFAR